MHLQQHRDTFVVTRKAFPYLHLVHPLVHMEHDFLCDMWYILLAARFTFLYVQFILAPDSVLGLPSR